jgi:hypothetical protein
MPSTFRGSAYFCNEPKDPMNPNPPASLHQFLEERIRQQAYFHWLEDGCPHGKDWEHWFSARQKVLALAAEASDQPPRPPGGPDSFSIRGTVAAHLSDPTHRFHALGTARDSRLHVVEGEARQRIRGRRLGGSLRSQPKKRS